MLNRNGGQPKLVNLNISENQGVGMVNDQTVPIISHVVLAGNTDSGLINKGVDNLVLNHVILSGNQNAGLKNVDSTVTVSQATISGNQNAGISNQTSLVTVNNSIIWDHEQSIFNDVSSQTLVNYSIVQGGWEGEGNKDQDPNFTTVIDPTTDHTALGNLHLNTDSPAIDAGDNALIPQDLGDAECPMGNHNTDEPVNADFDANLRLVNNRVDMGAYESPVGLPDYPLAVNVIGEGFVESNIPGIGCGEDCTHDFPSGTMVVLIAQPSEGTLFTRWDNGCEGTEGHTEILMNEAKQCTAIFDVEPIKLTINIEGKGIVTDETEELVCGSSCTVDYSPNQEIKLSTHPEAGFVFSHFAGDEDCADGTVTLAQDTTCQAIFTAVPEETVVKEPSPTPVLPPLPAETSQPCPPEDTLDYYCNAGGQTIGDLNIVENSDSTSGVGFLSNAVITGKVVLNHGTWISNLKVQKGASVSGGTVTGLNTNAGYMGDFVFKGEFIKGGKLGGKILNTSKIFSWFEDVTLTANAHLIGGALKGNIKGDPKNPALLENLRILSGSVISGVIIGNGVKIDKDVKIEESIQDDTPADEAELPTLNKQFSAGIGVNDSSYQTRNVAQILSDNVSIRGKIHVNKKHVGQKAKIFVTVAYRFNEDSSEEFLFTINQLNGLMPWDGDLEKLGENPFREEVLQTSHTVKIYDGILLATGVVKIRFGYLLENGTVVQTPESIELVTTE